MKTPDTSRPILVLIALLIGALACNAPTGEQQSPVDSAPRVTVGATAIPLPTLTPQTSSQSNPVDMPGERVEAWSYPMLYKNGACPAPGDPSMFTVAAFLADSETKIQPAVFFTFTVYPSMDSTSFSLGLSEFGTTPAKKTGYSTFIDMGTELTQSFPGLVGAPEAIEINFSIEVYDDSGQIVSTVVEDQSIMFCSSNPQDVAQYQAAWHNRTVEGTPDLVAWQTLLRYDGAQPEGTFEMTVCNVGTGTASPFEGQIDVNGVSARITRDQRLQPGECTDVFDPASSFSSFGVTQPGSVQVQGTIYPQDGDDPLGNNSFSRPMTINHLNTIVDDLNAYQNCRASQNHYSCWSNVQGTPIGENPHEVMKSRDGASVIVPVEFDAIAALHVADLVSCSTQIEEYLGVDFPVEIGNNMRMFDSVENGHYASYLGIELISEQGFMFQWILSGHQPLFNWNYTLKGLCGEAHEMTHMIVMRMPIQGWINEGLATYMDSAERIQAVHNDPLLCTADGLIRINSNGEEVIEPYANLTVSPEQTGDFVDAYGVTLTFARTRHYDTGACFWDYIERTFGHQTFQQVIHALDVYAQQRGNGCMPFLKDGVNPVLGTDISDVTKPRFGFDVGNSSCDT